MARGPLARLVRGSLALPGALFDALRPPPAATPPEPLLLRIRSVLARAAGAAEGPVTATYSEVRVYGPQGAPSPGRGLGGLLDLRGGSAEAPLDPVARDFAEVQEQLRRRLGLLSGTARETALALAARLEADLAAVATQIGDLRLPPRSPRKRRQALERLEGMLAVARALQIDASRGRRRDLRRIAATVRRLRELAKAGAARGPRGPARPRRAQPEGQLR
jgi:hypothetical protein